MKIGYARVSTSEQNLDGQIDQLNDAGVEKIFTDKISGAKAQRDGFSKMLDAARKGDTIIVCRLDRLARSLADLLAISAEFELRGLHFVSLAETLDTTSAGGRLIFNVLGSIAEFERNLIKERTTAGLAAARARGKKGGRTPVLTAEKKKTLDMLLDKSPDYEAHAKSIGVSERTVRRYANGEYVSQTNRISE